MEKMKKLDQSRAGPGVTVGVSALGSGNPQQNSESLTYIIL